MFIKYLWLIPAKTINAFWVLLTLSTSRKNRLMRTFSIIQIRHFSEVLRGSTDSRVEEPVSLYYSTLAYLYKKFHVTKTLSNYKHAKIHLDIYCH